MNHKLANSMQMWNENGNATTSSSLKFYSKREEVNAIIMDHFNSILFLKPNDLLTSSILINQLKYIAYAD